MAVNVLILTPNGQCLYCATIAVSERYKAEIHALNKLHDKMFRT